MASSTDVRIVYIPLLNEGTSVVRPAQAIRLRENVYQVLPTSDYDPDDEEWEFPPGTSVECEPETRSGQDVLVAKRRASTV